MALCDYYIHSKKKIQQSNSTKIKINNLFKINLTPFVKSIFLNYLNHLIFSFNLFMNFFLLWFFHIKIFIVTF